MSIWYQLVEGDEKSSAFKMSSSSSWVCQTHLTFIASRNSEASANGRVSRCDVPLTAVEKPPGIRQYSKNPEQTLINALNVWSLERTSSSQATVATAARNMKQGVVAFCEGLRHIPRRCCSPSEAILAGTRLETCLIWAIRA